MTDTVFAGGHVVTLAPGRARARALTVRGERLVAVGSVAECREAARPGFREVDLSGACVVPGFVDCHIHVANCARSKRFLNLRAATGLADAQRELRRYADALPAGAWVFGGRFDVNPWRLGRGLHRTDLDPHSGGHPIALQSHDGHTTWANSAALATLGIDARSADPPGGRIERDADGPTGLLRETAADPVRALIATLDQEPMERLLAEAGADLLAHGVTGVHDIDGIDADAGYRALRAGGALPVRVHQLISKRGLDAAIEAGSATGDGDAWLSVGPVKLFSDGALGSRTAAMSEPYEGGDADDRGVAVLDTEQLTELVDTAARAGIAAAVHAIGDAANTAVLDAIASVRAAGLGPQLRHRIEHAQHVSWPDVDRFAELGVIASMQPIHCTSDIEVAAAILGRRPLASYAWADLVGTGARVAFGSDAPVETLDPIAGIRAATTRRDATTGGRDPDRLNALTPLQALRAYTTQAAFASYQEHDKGRLAPGFLADFVALDADLTDRDVATSGAAKVTVTVVGGEVRWARGGRAA
jgi:predicted amidohydrolase YtcJ